MEQLCQVSNACQADYNAIREASQGIQIKIESSEDFLS
jgi:hypothetical protein